MTITLFTSRRNTVRGQGAGHEDVRVTLPGRVQAKGDGSCDIVVFGNYPVAGGVPRRLANIIHVWVDLGYRVQVVSFRDGQLFYPDELGGRVEFVDLGTRSKVLTLVALWRHLRRARPSVVLSTAHLANTIVARLGQLPATGARRCLSVPNTFGASTKKSARDKARKLKNVRALYRRADAVIAISHGVQHDLTETIGLKDVPVPCIFNGSVSPRMLVRAREPIDHPWLQRDRDLPVILSVGRLAAQKDQKTLVDAVASLAKRRPCRLIILGEGPLEDMLRRRAAEHGMARRFDLPGFVANPYAWMARADCFVLSSLWEGFPNVLAEALGVGVPVVSTDCPSGPRDILQHGRFGQLVPMGDSEALAQAIDEVLAGERPTFDRDAAVRPFTAETVAHRYLDVFGLGDGTADG